MSDEELIARLRDEHVAASRNEAAARIEALTAKVKLMDDLDAINGEKIEALTAELNTVMDNTVAELEAKLAECEARLGKAVEALDSVMVGGNHLATILPDNFPPAETEPLIALETVGYGYGYEVWCCWRSIMLARTTLAELTGGKDE